MATLRKPLVKKRGRPVGSKSPKKNIPNMALKFENKEAKVITTVLWTGSLLRKAFSQLFYEQNISDAQFNILRILAHLDGPFTQNDLSRLLIVDKSNITGLVDKLEEVKLVKRKNVKTDRRSYHVEIMSEGRELVKELEKNYVKYVCKLVHNFSKEELTQFQEFAERLKLNTVEIANIQE